MAPKRATTKSPKAGRSPRSRTKSPGRSPSKSPHPFPRRPATGLFSNLSPNKSGAKKNSSGQSSGGWSDGTPHFYGISHDDWRALPPFARKQIQSVSQENRNPLGLPFMNGLSSEEMRREEMGYLKALAASKQITLPASLDAKHQATRDRLAKLSGDAFDRAYITEMVAGHQKAVSDFTAESTSGTDSDVKAWAGTTLPTPRDSRVAPLRARESSLGGRCRSGIWRRD